MNPVLLTAAGFSRNWGGWLASEAFEYLIGHPAVDTDLRNLLWRHKDRGFEFTLGELQKAQIRSNAPEPMLQKLQTAILAMFGEMDEAFSKVQFEFLLNNLIARYTVLEFLICFNAIFTLNQDLLLERFYLNDNIVLRTKRWGNRWNDWDIPGMRRPANHPSGNPNLGQWVTDPARMAIRQNVQPYIKLHGSSNWIDDQSRELLVLGANKSEVIGKYPILNWNHERFREFLVKPDTRLIIIGYGFNDHHINNIILQTAQVGNLKIFIIDPLGVDVVDKNIGATIRRASDFATAIWPYVFGASRRSLREIFGGDWVEHGKIMKFFS